MKVVLLSTYELGRQPFGLASPAAWLRRAGHEVTCADLAVGSLPSVEVQAADLIAVYVPMHTATRLAAPVLQRARALNADAHLCCYGLYAPLNREYFRNLGVQSILGGEFEAGLTRLAESLQPVSETSLERLQFIAPDRTRLPVLSRYPKLVLGAAKKRVGSTEASRGCKHLCRHCPVVPVYQGAFRIVQADIVLEDIRQQVAAGAEHISFGDPDFLNGPGHARRIVEALHAEFPALSYDVTTKVEHLLKHREALPMLRDTGCVFIVSAVESVQDDVLEKLDKGHTKADFETVADMLRETGLVLTPTFLPFTPWTTMEGFQDLLTSVRRLGLTEHVNPVQWSLRLLIPSGSRLLELEEVRDLVDPFDQKALAYPWRHPDEEVDRLAERVSAIVRAGVASRKSRTELFREIWTQAYGEPLAEPVWHAFDGPIPYMEEAWFCCAEPTEEQLKALAL